MNPFLEIYLISTSQDSTGIDLFLTIDNFIDLRITINLYFLLQIYQNFRKNLTIYLLDYNDIEFYV